MGSIVSVIFSYLKLLQMVGPKEELWNEMKAMDDTHFQFYVESDPLGLVTDLAEDMTIFPNEKLISGPFLSLYDSELIRSCLSHLTVENVCIVLYSKDYLDDCHELEQWHKVKYSIEDSPTDWMTK